MAELIWDGKYDKQGRKIAPPRYSLEFQTVETVNESVADRLKTLSFLTDRREPDWRNRLIWGDKKYILPSLLKEFAGKVNLIYIDPPFATGANFSYRSRIPENPEASVEVSAEFTKQPSMIEEKAYRDTWGRGIDSYLQWFYETAIYLRELLADNGSIYVHCDWRLSAHLKVLLDEIFGSTMFMNEIIREKTNPKNYTKIGYGNIHDTILSYTKNSEPIWNRPYDQRNDDKIIKDFPHIDERTQERYKTAPLHAPGVRYGETGTAWRGLMPPTGNHWRYVHKTLDELDTAGHVEWSQTGNPREKIYSEESLGLYVQDIWLGLKDSKVEYPSAKNETILERIIKASSNPSDLVLDCFAGSGTTAVVAEKLGRRWITCDLSRFSIHTARKRLLGIPEVKPFVVQNLGKYERQAWQVGSFGGKDGPQLEYEYRQFILGLYHAEPISGFERLHGVKAGRMIHVGAVDSPITLAETKSIALELKKAVGSGNARRAEADILYWDLAFDMNELGRQIADSAGVNVRFFKIPREVMDKKAIEQGDIKFFELAALGVKVDFKAKKVSIKLTDFMMPLEEVPEDVRKAVTHWSQWIDYWAVDWDYKDDAFHNQDQHYRTHKETKLPLETEHNYEKAGRHNLMIKVIDIFGNDTTKLTYVEVW